MRGNSLPQQLGVNERGSTSNKESVRQKVKQHSLLRYYKLKRAQKTRREVLTYANLESTNSNAYIKSQTNCALKVR